MSLLKEIWIGHFPHRFMSLLREIWIGHFPHRFMSLLREIWIGHFPHTFMSLLREHLPLLGRKRGGRKEEEGGRETKI